MKKLALGILGLLIVLVAAVFIGPSVMNWNGYKADIATAVKEALMEPLRQCEQAEYFYKNKEGMYSPCKKGADGAERMSLLGDEDEEGEDAEGDEEAREDASSDD